MRATIAALAACLPLVACTGGDPADETATSSTAPTPAVIQGWPTVTPERAGFDPARLGSIADEAKSLESSCIAVVRDGRLVGDRNWEVGRSAPREVFSVTKSVVSALVGIAADDGDLALDDPVADYVPAWRGTPSATVTVRDLLSNDSGRTWSSTSDYQRLLAVRDRTAYAVGLEQQHPPGTTWAYNNAAIQVLDRVLSTATHTPTDEYAAARLFRPLGMTHTRMTRDASDRSTNVFYGVQSTCLDLARFGQLYLDHGAVGARQLVPAAYVEASVARPSTALNAAYGYLWWINREGQQRGPLDPVDARGRPVTPRTGQLLPSAPADVFAAIGLGGQVVLVDPGSRTVAVRLGAESPEPGGYGLGNLSRVVTWALTG